MLLEERVCMGYNPFHKVKEDEPKIFLNGKVGIGFSVFLKGQVGTGFCFS